MSWTNYHSHCDFCDGGAPAESYLLEAIAQGFRVYGYSSHAPLPFERPWAMPQDKLSQYIQQLSTLRTKYLGQIELCIGLEIDYLPGVSWWDFHGQALRNLDYTIGSVHMVEAFPDNRPWEVDGTTAEFEQGLAQIFKGDFKAAATRYFELIRWMVMLENPDIIGHFDKLKIHNLGGKYFSEEDNWYRREVDKTLKVISNMGSIVEVNTRGIYTGKSLDLYPSQWILERMHAMRIPVMINSDAHLPAEISTGFEFAARTLQKAGFRQVMVLLDGHWQSVPLDEKGLRIAGMDESVGKRRSA
jgi:histidinol-phosphatase (PHP family)